jgi:hypothetical protein
MNKDELESDYLWGRRHAALYRVELSALYHQKRERFFDFCDRGAKVVSIVGGSAALYKLSDNEVVAIAAAAITVVSALSLVLGFGEKARRHSELARNFKQVQAEMLRIGERDYDEDHLRDWEARIALLEASEPASLGVLVRICQNELASVKPDGKPRKVGWWRWPLAHLFDLPLPTDPPAAK